MSVQQYGRQISVIVGAQSGQALEFSQFRCVFTIRRGDFQTPNSCDLRIYNIADNTANQIRKEFTQLIVQAGYPGNYGLIFTGSIKQYRLGRVDQKDSYVDITAADGDQAYNYATISQSFEAANATPSAIRAALSKAMSRFGVSETPGYEPNYVPNTPVRGRVMFGLARDEMREFAAQNNCTWSIQDGKLVLIPITGYIPGQTPVISPQTGLIGVPEQTQNGISIRVLLNPFLKIGQAIKLDSTINRYRYALDLPSTATNETTAASIKTNADGLYYVMAANHSGDTRGNTWYTDLTCLAIDATVPLNNPNPGFAAPSGQIPQFP